MRPRPRRSTAMRRRRRRHLPGDVLRRSLARPRRLPASGRAAEPARRLELRRRRHEARPPRQGRRRSSRCASTPTGSSSSRGSHRRRCTSSPATASARASRSPITRPTTAASRPASRRWCSDRAAASRSTYPEPGGPLPGLRLVRRSASTGAGPTTTSRSSPGMSRAQRSALVDGRRADAAGARRVPTPERPVADIGAAGRSTRIRDQARLQVEGEDREHAPLRAHRAGAAGRKRAAAACACAPPRTVAVATSSSTSRPTRGCSRTGSSTSSASSSDGRTGAATITAIWAPRPSRARRRRSRRSSTW